VLRGAVVKTAALDLSENQKAVHGTAFFCFKMMQTVRI
jgi:hypothetical protein